MTSEDFYYLFSGENREVCNVVLRQPRICELLKYDVDVDEMVQPFFAFVHMCDMSQDMMTKFKNLDILFNDHFMCEKENCVHNSMLIAMITTLKYLTRNNNIDYDVNNFTISVNGIEKINRDNFDELQLYILSIFYAKKPEKQKVKGSDAQKKLVEKMQQKMAMHRKKKSLTIADILKVVQNGGEFIKHQDLLEFTYWQLMDRYADIMKIDAYKTYMDYKLSAKYELKDNDRKHWSEDLKVGIE